MPPIMEKVEPAIVTTGAEIHPDLEKTATRRSHLDAIAPELMASEADAELLAKLGYTQELRRNFRWIEIFGISFSIIGLLPSIASTLAFSIPAGPAGMVWGWFTASMFIFIVGVAMADLGSAMPTAGGLYWWTFHFASEKYRKALCFLVGYSNTLGYIAGLCSIDYGFALMLCSVVVVARDGNWTPSNGIIYSVFLGCVIVHGILASMLSKILNKLQTVSVALQLILIVATIIALPIGRSSERNTAKFTFAQTENLTTWPIGWAFMLSWLSPIWTIGGFDSCVHMSEEAKNAAKAVPYGIMMATGSTWILGFIIMIVLGFCINPNLEDVLGTGFGQPMAQIYFDALGKNGTLGFMTLLFVCQFTMGLSILVAASRQTWAFSRDGALPFSTFFRPISKTLGYVPLRCIWGCVLAALILGLLSLIAPAASSALFALTVTGNNLAYAIPIFSRVFWGQHKFTPGAFYTGPVLSPIIAWVAVIYLVFSTILVMFPGGGPDPEPSAMNYAVVINAAVWGGSMIYYFAFARKWFKGPKTTIGIEGVSGGQGGAFTSGGSDSDVVEKVADGESTENQQIAEKHTG